MQVRDQPVPERDGGYGSAVDAAAVGAAQWKRLGPLNSSESTPYNHASECHQATASSSCTGKPQQYLPIGACSDSSFAPSFTHLGCDIADRA